ncbi:hypothetical protein GCM10025734_66550 [Kitasatospora paranensis]
MQVGLGEPVALREAGVAQAERPVDQPAEQFLVAAAGGGLGHQRDGDVVGVGVPVAAAGGEEQALVGDVVEQVPGVEDVVRVGRDDGAEGRGVAVVRQPAGVLEELAECHGRPGRREVGEALPEGVVQAEGPAVDQPERDGAAERLGDAGDPHVVVGARCARLPHLGDTGAVDLRAVAAPEDRDGTGRPASGAHQLVEPVLERGRAVGAAARLGVGGDEGDQRRRREQGGGAPARPVEASGWERASGHGTDLQVGRGRPGGLGLPAA